MLDEFLLFLTFITAVFDKFILNNNDVAEELL